MRFSLRTLLIVVTLGSLGSLVSVAMFWRSWSSLSGNVRRQHARSLHQEAILGNMPLNSDLRCSGITLVADALLHVAPSDDDGLDTPEDVGRGIVDRLMSGRALRYRSVLRIDGKQEPIISRDAQERLSTVVTTLLRERYLQLIATDEGKRKWVDAHRYVRTSAELEDVLNAHADKICAFGGSGTREFFGGTKATTDHAFLVCKMPDGQTMVYDPNHPGIPLPCTFFMTNEGLGAR